MSNSDSSSLTNTQQQLHSCQNELADVLKKLSKVERKLAKAQNYNNDLLDELDELKRELHENRRARKIKKITVGTQTNSSGFSEPNSMTCDEASNHDNSSTEKVESVAEAVYEPLSQELVTENGKPQSIAEQLRFAAEQAIVQSDYVYDENSEMYYDQQTGYYYNPETKLYYDSTNCCYCTFNEQSQQYEFHSQADMSQYEEYYKHQAIKNEKMARKVVKEAKKNARLAKQELKRACQSNEEVAKRLRQDTPTTSLEHSDVLAVETSNQTMQDNHSVVSNHSSSTEEGEVASSDGEFSELSDSANDEAEVLWRPPCVRAIVEESDSIDVGSLHIITITGGTIGSADGSIIHIPEETVKEAHCKITYSEENKGYYAVELGSASGTFINSRRLSQPGESATLRLSNRDRLQVGSTELLLHIHPGTDTCTDCEPGVIETRLRASRKQQSDAVPILRADVERERRRQIKSIKKKYGLEGEKYRRGEVNIDSKYVDKSEKRRQIHGLDLPGIPDAPAASVDAAIPTGNMGHKLLQKMGWKTGQSLGKSETGIVEPIKVDLRLNASAGLGSQSNRTISMDDGGQLPKARRKAEMMLKVQRRFKQANTSDFFKQVDDDEEDADNSSK